MQTLVANISGRIRRKRVGGRDYIVAPMTLIVPGVLAGNRGPGLYTRKEAAKTVDAWNGVPLVVYHPYQNGKAVSAKNKSVLDSQGVGTVKNSKSNGKVTADAWFDTELTKKVDRRVYDALVSHKQIGLSTGLDLDQEPAPKDATHNGTPYEWTARNYRPDHVAILPDQVGACSIPDGCGVLNQIVFNVVETNSQGTQSSPAVFKLGAAIQADDPEILKENGRRMKKKTKTAYNKLHEVSHDQIRDQLDVVLRSRFKQDEPSAYISVVFDTYFVYHQGEDMYRLDYTRNDSGVALGAKPVKVKREISFKPVANRETVMAEMTKDECVDFLITNCDCWAEDDRTTLNDMPDERLAKFKEALDKTQRLEAVANTAVVGYTDDVGNSVAFDAEKGEWKVELKTANAKPAGQSDGVQQMTVPETTEGWVRIAPDEVRSTYEAAQKIEQTEKDKIIERLTVNIPEGSKRVHAERLQERSLDDLRNDLELIPASTSQIQNDEGGDNSGAAWAAQRAQSTADQDQEDPLIAPTINWNDKSHPINTAPPQKDRVAAPSKADASYLDKAPPHIQVMIKNAKAIEDRERDQLIDRIVANVADDEERERLRDRLGQKSINELNDFLILAGPSQKGPFKRPANFSAAAAPATNASPGQDEDLLPLPVMNYVKSPDRTTVTQ